MQHSRVTKCTWAPARDFTAWTGRTAGTTNARTSRWDFCVFQSLTTQLARLLSSKRYRGRSIPNRGRFIPNSLCCQLFHRLLSSRQSLVSHLDIRHSISFLGKAFLSNRIFVVDNWSLITDRWNKFNRWSCLLYIHLDA